MPTFALAVFGSFFASLFATWGWRWLACRLGCFDVPNARSSHVSQVPRSGGMAFAAVFLVSTGMLVSGAPSLGEWWPVYLASILLLLTGFVDDIRGLGIGIRLVMQAMTLVLAIAVMPGLPSLHLPAGPAFAGAALVLLVFVSWLWFINLYNFMDGLDALAGSEAIFASLAIALLAGMAGAWDLCQLATLLAACLAGFLVLNLPPASLFMGDAGSNFLGFILFALALSGIAEGALTPWTVLILFGVFIVDSSFTLLRRMLGGELWYHGHRSHAYQRAADALASHGKVVAAVSLLNLCWLLPLAWLSTRFERAGVVLVLVAWTPLLWLSIRMAPRVRAGEVEGRG